MTLSEFIRVMDLNWLDFLWGGVWGIIITGALSAMIFSSAWAMGRDSYIKNVLPNLYKEQRSEIKKLRYELKAALEEIDNYKQKLFIIKESVEVCK